MNKNVKWHNRKIVPLLFGGVALILFVFFQAIHLVSAQPEHQQEEPIYEIVGRLHNEQGQTVKNAHVYGYDSAGEILLGEATSDEEGYWVLVLNDAPQSLELVISRPHYKEFQQALTEQELQILHDGGAFAIPDQVIERRIDAAFWASTAVFLLVLGVIAFERLHSTTASLAAMSMIFLISFVGGAFWEDLFIFDLETALSYINWEVIFLVMGMMIIVAIIESTGIFQWTAFQAYRLSRGRSWILVLILIVITSIASALLDNFTTMLLITPISLQIGLAMGINPLALIIPEVLASNVSGISTLIGTPTNILIGAYAGIGFNDFLTNQTIGIILALAVLSGYVLFHYRAEWKKQSGGISERLYEVLRKNAEIEDPNTLWKSGLVFVFVLIGFILGERIHVAPAVPALVGAAMLFVWLKPDVTKTIEAVDWTTLVFFMSLFIVVGAIQEVGLISIIASGMQKIVGENLILAIFVIIFGVGTLSTCIANIPLAASMLPVVEFLSGSIPGASSKVLYYALSIGAAMGGNGFLIGGEANLVTAGITKQAGTPIAFKDFLKIGLPVTYLTLTVGFIWLVIRFVLFGSS